MCATAPTGYVENTSRSHLSWEAGRGGRLRGWGTELNWSWEPGFGKSLKGVSIPKCHSLQCYDGGSGHLCARAVTMLCESEVTASTFRHLSAFSCSETKEGGLGSFAPTLFNLIVKYKRQFPPIESYLGLSAHSHLSPLNITPENFTQKVKSPEDWTQEMQPNANPPDIAETSSTMSSSPWSKPE